MLQVECVGSVSGGLLCMGWSPEQDLAVFVTGEENLLVMTREFDPISETPAHPEEFGEGQHEHCCYVPPLLSSSYDPPLMTLLL